jgi:excisionase family DNA binding protein
MTEHAPSSSVSPWLTVRDVAARAQCGIKLVRYAIKTGKLKAARLGIRNALRVHETWVDAWMERAVVVHPDAPGADPLPFTSSSKRR